MANPLIVDGRNLLDPEATRARRLRLRGHRPAASPTDVLPETPSAPRRVSSAMEAIILAGGKAERLGDAAGGRPKSLVDVAGQAARRLPGRPARARRRRRA